jgi:uracil phosphoribosyltransferase
MSPFEDSQYNSSRYQPQEREHKYGKQIHLIDDPYLLTLAAELSDPATVQPRFNEIIVEMYRILFQIVANCCLQREKISRPTRMHPQNPRAIFSGEVIARHQKVVLVDLARAGMLPAAEGLNFFTRVLAPENVRIDHIFISRAIDSIKHQVVGTDIAGTKIGGPVDDALLLIPDPMGATGISVINTLELYAERVKGTPQRCIVINLITAPEAIVSLRQRFPDVELFTVRLDRGLSDPKVLASVPGSNAEAEKGLNENQYIVPGAGGVGEIMNNSFA